MAGIGFELRKLARRDDLLGLVESYTHSALASSGPWLFTILSLGGVVMLGSRFVSPDDMSQFRLIIIYNFAFSLVLSGPIVMVSTRFLADSICKKDVSQAPSMLLTGYLVLFLMAMPLVLPFYLYFVQLDLGVRLIAIANFFVVAGIWQGCLFLTALKDYRNVSGSFAVGMGAALAGAMLLSPFFGLPGMILGFTLGLLYLLSSLFGRILAEYPYAMKSIFDFRPHVRRHWELALSGFVYNLGIWIDKWIMWAAPQHAVMPSGFVSYPDYDSAMFLAYLTIVPSMASFVLSIETDFFEKYIQYYRDIQGHATLERIRTNHASLIDSIVRGARNFIVLQGTISIVSILLAPRLFSLLNISFMQLGMFRIGILGAFFQVLLMAMMIILSYFDQRRIALRIQLFFLGSNALLTFISMRAGFRFYGYGYFIACLATFTVTFIALSRSLKSLPYQTFVLNNSSVRGQASKT